MVTIIVLLILAGVTINLVAGNNGIITKANESRRETQIASEKEEISMAVMAAKITNNGFEELDQNNLQREMDNQLGEGKTIVTSYEDGTWVVNFLETMRRYAITTNGIEKIEDWNEIFEKAKAPQEQVLSGVIGIGTNGKSVNMDLWKYILLEDGTYALNEHSGAIEEKTNGYKGNIVNGKIQGSIPAYINEGNGFISVTSLYQTFYNQPELVTIPEIPHTVTTMTETFYGCSNLVQTNTIPNSVTSMRGTFYACASLKTAPILPNSVMNIDYIFKECAGLIEVLNIPQVISMTQSFSGCMSLKEIPPLPSTVTELPYTFNRCESLTVVPNIPNSIIKLDRTFERMYKFKNSTNDS